MRGLLRAGENGLLVWRYGQDEEQLAGGSARALLALGLLALC